MIDQLARLTAALIVTALIMVVMYAALCFIYMDVVIIDAKIIRAVGVFGLFIVWRDMGGKSKRAVAPQVSAADSSPQHQAG